jgi:predicted GH43/DUF377 family glycosyl hydrolase
MNVVRKNIILKPDPKRVLFRPFAPKTRKQALKIISRILLLSEDEVAKQLNNVISEFGDRHQKINNYLMQRFKEIKDLIFTDIKLSKERQLLIGSYFTLEYSFESAALFNPSLIWFPDVSHQSGKTRKFILSLRAVGEGHVSSLTFRSGEINSNKEIRIDPCKKFVTSPEFIPDKLYEKTLFERKLHELGFTGDFTTKVLMGLKKTFTFSELNDSINYSLREYSNRRGDNEFLANKIILLARSNYEVVFNKNQDISERVIFPSTPNELNGIEDARFVEFKEDDGSITYYATYTAYDGEVTLPQLLETKDFLHFKISTLNGPAVQNKGMALFPRKIDGHYAMLSRQDGENIFIMFSDMIHFWYTKQILLRPTYEWEFTKIGNCGSPIETDEGWLVLSHGVGPMRKYALGAFLLDKDDPRKVIGRTKEPILTTNESEREGYVPNVIYSCGGKIFNGDLVIPYAMSDYASSFATVNLKELIAEMKEK